MATRAVAIDDEQGNVARAQVKPGFSLPAYYYNDPSRYESDLDILTEEMWWMAGHASQIPKRGDYFLFDLAGESIIIVRGRDDQINAFFNVCRHRGSRVCLEPSGNAKMMVCPYHSWSYDGDGKLIGAPDMPAWFDKKDYGLHPAHIGVADGVIFINISRKTQPDFAAFARRLQPFMRFYELGKAKMVAQTLLPCPANWKLVIENFAECYHCPGSHKEFSRTHRLDTMLEMNVEDCGEAEWAQRMQAQGLMVEPLFDGIESIHMQSAMRIQIGGKSLSGGANGSAVAPLMGKLDDWSGSWTAVIFNPMCQIACYDDHAVLFSFIPRGPTSTDCLLTWLVREDAEEGVDYDPEAVSYLWRMTIAEDKTICENNQLGVLSAAYQPGPYSKTESRAQSCVDWYLHHYVDGAA